MKWLKQLRLINWHYFHDEILEFGRQTLISGQNGAGKSTIIDALQVLFIADQRQIKFNSSAHDEAKRTMINYLRGKIGSQERAFLREGDFNTYILAEFFDDKRREHFIIGVVIDVFRDQTFEEEFFILDAMKLADLNLVKSSGQLRNREDFRRYCGGARGRAIFERNKANYQKALRNRLGQLPERFFSVFTKALSFRPIKDVRDFVYDYILDKKELQLDLMRQNFEIHERYQRELDALQERKEKLQQIAEQFAQFQKWKEITITQDYVIRGLKYQQQVEIQERQQRELDFRRNNLQELQSSLTLQERKQHEAKEQTQLAFALWQNHDSKKQAEALEQGIEQLSKKIAEDRRSLQLFQNQLKDGLHLLSTLGEWSGNRFWQWQGAEKEKVNHFQELLIIILKMTDLEQDRGLNYDQEELASQLREGAHYLSTLHERFMKASVRYEDEIKALETQIETLTQEIRDLENKKRTYPPSVAKLKKLLEERLQKPSPVRILCEEMEVLEENWRDAIEGYLHTQKFDLLVDPQCFAEALSLYEREKWQLGLEGVGLVDTEKERKYLGSSQAGSLAKLLQSEDKIITARIEHLLGKVMQAKDEKDLRNYHTAVTQSCMTYHNLVARQIPKSRYEIPYIGSQAILRQLEIKKGQLAELQSLRDTLLQESDSNQKLLSTIKERQTLCNSLIGQLQLPLVQRNQLAELAGLQEELARLDLTEVEALEKAYAGWSQREQALTQEINKINKEIATLEERLKQGETASYVQAGQVKRAEDYWQSWSQAYALASQILPKAQKSLEKALAQAVAMEKKLENWESNYKSNITRRDTSFVALRDLRQKYNFTYSYNANLQGEENEDYQKLLREIEEVDLPRYQEKLQEALKEAEEEFKSHFIYKMREAIEMAKREFHELNHALRNFPFHEDKYHFEVKASERYKRFYDVIMDPQVVEKGSLFDLPEDSKSAHLHELFEVLIRGQAGDQEEFTDYRRYLDFDIIVQSRGTRYSFSQVLREKSGGETQTPFYIAILASFHHLYASQKTMRLVVFDEAFNKMDEQRIQTSLRLIKQMNLQLIAAVPDEKMQHMVPEVTTTLLVNNINFRCFVDLLERVETAGETNEEINPPGTEYQKKISGQDSLFVAK